LNIQQVGAESVENSTVDQAFLRRKIAVCAAFSSSRPHRMLLARKMHLLSAMHSLSDFVS
jgi:hypothetical protein